MEERSRGKICPSYESSTALIKQRGRRECRALIAPAALRAVKKARKQVTTGTPKRSGIPCAMVLRLIARSPRGTGLDSPRDLRIARKLDPSVGGSGPHAFAVRVSALRQVAPTRPSHPGPRVVTIAIRPSSGARDGATIRPISFLIKRIIFGIRA